MLKEKIGIIGAGKIGTSLLLLATLCMAVARYL